MLCSALWTEIDRDPERQGVAVVIHVSKILSATGEVLQER